MDKNIKNTLPVEQIRNVHGVLLTLNRFSRVIDEEKLGELLFKELDISNKYDIILEIIEPDDSTIKYYSVNRRLFYNGYEDKSLTEYCERLSKVKDRKFEEIGVMTMVIDGKSGETNEPILWFSFLKQFYRRFCSTDDEAMVLVEFAIRVLSASLLERPYMEDISNSKLQETALIAYNHDFFRTTAIPVVISSLSTKYLEKVLEGKEDVTVDSNIVIENQDQILTIPLDIFDFLSTFDVNIDKTLLFNIVFLIRDIDIVGPTFCLMPLVHKTLVDNLLYFPFLAPTYQDITPEDLKNYQEIVKQEYNNILYHCYTKDVTKSLYYLAIVRGYIKSR